MLKMKLTGFSLCVSKMSNKVILLPNTYLKQTRIQGMKIIWQQKPNVSNMIKKMYI